jgi:hypothetical protein
MRVATERIRSSVTVCDVQGYRILLAFLTHLTMNPKSWDILKLICLEPLAHLTCLVILAAEIGTVHGYVSNFNYIFIDKRKHYMCKIGMFHALLYILFLQTFHKCVEN